MARRSFGNLRKLPSGRWQASYTDDITGKRIAAPSTFGTKADAALTGRWRRQPTEGVRDATGVDVEMTDDCKIH